MNTLWEISETIIDIENQINDILENEELSDEDKEEQTNKLLNNWFEGGVNFKQKAEKLANYIKHEEAITKARKEEVKRLQNLAKQSENKANRLKEYLIHQMEKTNNTKIEGVKHKLSLRKKPPELKIKTSVENLPKEFVEIEYKLKKSEIKKFLKKFDYQECEWAKMSDNKENSLIIK